MSGSGQAVGAWPGCRSQQQGRTTMRYRGWIVAFGSLVALCITLSESRAWDETRYPDLKGQWRPIGDPMRFDPSKAWGPGQQAPLTPEYQALFEANLKDQAAGGQGLAQTNTCISPGMPRVTNGYGQIEVVVTPRTTRSEEHTSELQSPDHLVCRLLLEKKKKTYTLHDMMYSSTIMTFAS